MHSCVKIHVNTLKWAGKTEREKKYKGHSESSDSRRLTLLNVLRGTNAIHVKKAIRLTLTLIPSTIQTYIF